MKCGASKIKFAPLEKVTILDGQMQKKTNESIKVEWIVDMVDLIRQKQT